MKYKISHQQFYTYTYTYLKSPINLECLGASIILLHYFYTILFNKNILLLLFLTKNRPNPVYLNNLKIQFYFLIGF